MNQPRKTPMQRVAEAKDNITEITILDLVESEKSKQVIIDVREAHELSVGTILDAVNVPRGMIEFEVMKHCEADGWHTELVLYCKTGGRSALACEALQDLGFTNVHSLAGGYEAWDKHHK